MSISRLDTKFKVGDTVISAMTTGLNPDGSWHEIVHDMVMSSYWRIIGVGWLNDTPTYFMERGVECQHLNVCAVPKADREFVPFDVFAGPLV